MLRSTRERQIRRRCRRPSPGYEEPPSPAVILIPTECRPRPRQSSQAEHRGAGGSVVGGQAPGDAAHGDQDDANACMGGG